MADLTGRTALVTGCSGAIGARICADLAERGAVVIGVDQTEPASRPPSAEDSSQFHHLTKFELVDLESEAAVTALTARLNAEFGAVQLVVNNAAISLKQAATATSNADWNRLLRINLGAPAQLLRELSPGFVAGSSVVNISSIRATRGFTNDAAYSAAKGGIESLTRALAIELAPTTRVNAVSPGAISTAMTAPVHNNPGRLAAAEAAIPLGRFGSPREVSAAVLFLLSEDAAFITGATLDVDGGQSSAG